MSFVAGLSHTGVLQLRTVAVATLDAHGVEIVRWPIKHCGAIDLALVDRVARVHLAARRTGQSVTLRYTAPELLELLDLAGLLELAAREPAPER